MARAIRRFQCIRATKRVAEVWEFLFLNGEFAPRRTILEGLTLEHVSARPAGVTHSIYEELWHTVHWQKVVLEQDAQATKLWEQGISFPASAAPRDESEWQELVASFLALSAQAVQMAQDKTWLESEEGVENSGFTWRNALEQLAVHNAYHMGKIVLLRQILGCWNPR